VRRHRTPRALAARARAIVGFAAICACAPGQDEHGAEPALLAPATVVSASEETRSSGAAASAWREALELDLPAEVADDGLGRVAPGGAFAHDGVCLALVARALFETGREERALSLLDTSRPTVGAEHVDIARARLALERDELERALELLAPPEGSDSATLHPLVPECWLVHGRAFARKGELARAAPYLARFVELAPRDPEAAAALYLLVEHAMDERDEERARAYERRATELSRWHAYYNARRLQVREEPDAPLPRLGLAKLWLAADENTRAREVLRELTERHPEFARGWATLGDAFQRTGDLDYAGEAWDRALELDPELVETRLNRARLALYDERPKDARRDLEHIVGGAAGADESFAAAHLLLAQLLLNAGETDAASARFDHYRQLGGTEPLE